MYGSAKRSEIEAAQNLAYFAPLVPTTEMRWTLTPQGEVALEMADAVACNCILCRAHAEMDRADNLIRECRERPVTVRPETVYREV